MTNLYDENNVLTFHNSKFEKEVRLKLNIYDRAITVADARNVQELDLSEIDLIKEDIEILFCFENLKVLALPCVDIEDASFWEHFPILRELYWDFPSGMEQISMEMFVNLTQLEHLSLSGGDLSSTRLVNLDALIPLEKLESISFFEFGTVDLAPLEQMTQLRYLHLEYPDSVEHVEVLTRMDWMEEIMLYDVPGNNTNQLIKDKKSQVMLV